MDRRGTGIEIGCNGDRHVMGAQLRDRRHLLLAQIIEGAGQQHRDRPGLGDGHDAGFVEIFDMIDGQRAIARRERRAAQIGELLGMELDRKPQGFGGLEDLLRLLDRKGDALAETVNRIGKSCLMSGRQGLLRRRASHSRRGLRDSPAERHGRRGRSSRPRPAGACPSSRATLSILSSVSTSSP